MTKETIKTKIQKKLGKLLIENMKLINYPTKIFFFFILIMQKCRYCDLSQVQYQFCSFYRISFLEKIAVRQENWLTGAWAVLQIKELSSVVQKIVNWTVPGFLIKYFPLNLPSSFHDPECYIESLPVGIH